MPAKHTDRHWEWYGEREPYYGVLSDAKFLRAALTETARTEFFASGERYAASLWEIIQQHLGVSFAPARVLDFGCGVGRVLIPLSRRSAEAVGVDVSRSMLREARSNCESAGAANVQLVAGDDHLSGVVGGFDFIHSYIVFQHIPVRLGETLTRRLLDLLREGGVGALHFTYSVRKSLALRAYIWAKLHVPMLQSLVNLARRRPAGTGIIQMNEYSITRLVRILHDAGCHEICSRATLHGENEGFPAHGVMLIFRKRRLADL